MSDARTRIEIVIRAATLASHVLKLVNDAPTKTCRRLVLQAVKQQVAEIEKLIEKSC